MKLTLPEIEGKYEVLEKLKEGGMGAIYKVRHRLLGEVRVIKVIRPQLEEDSELKARFLREARMGIKLRHPNIAQLYDFTMDEAGTAYMVMEFIDGFTLQGILKRSGSPPTGLVLEASRQALRALAYLHKRGFVHRDIAPDNLMLTRDLEGAPLVKLIDLGIAKGLKGGAEAELTATGMFLGKLRYAAPEQFQPSGGMDGRADLYSYGIVLYELLTGHYPIAGDGPPSIMAGHLFQAPKPFTETDPEGRVGEELRRIVLRCLAKKPDERFADARELWDHLEPLLRDHPFEAEAFQRLIEGLRQARAGDLAEIAGESTAERLQAQFPSVPTPPPTQATVAKPTSGAHTVASEELASQVRELLRKADELSAAGSFTEARKELEMARMLAPDDGDVRSRFEAVDAQYQRQLAQAAERMRSVTELAGQIQEQLQTGELAAAREALRQGRETFGEQATLVALEERLEELERRQQEVQRRVQEIRKQLAAGLSPELREAVDELAAAYPGEPAVDRLRAEVEEAREEGRTAELAGRVESALAAGEPAAAAEGLRRLEEAAPAHPELGALRRRVREAREDLRLAQRMASIEASLTEEESAGAEDPSPPEASEPDGSEPLGPLKDHLSQLLDSGEPRQREELAGATAAIQAHLLVRHLAAARESLEEAEGTYGAEAFGGMRRRLEELEQEQDRLAEHLQEAEELLAASKWRAAEVHLQEILRRDPDHAAARALKERLEEGRQADLENDVTALLPESPAAPPPPTVIAPTPELPPEEPVPAHLETVFSPPSAQSPSIAPPLPASQPTPEAGPASSRRWQLGAVVAVVLVLAVLVGLWLSRGSSTPEDGAVGAAAAPGVVVVTALPWAEVIAILDEAGEALPLPEPPYTPLRLELPAGAYRFSLSHPARPEVLEMTVTAAAGETVREVVPVAPATAEELLEELGW